MTFAPRIVWGDLDLTDQPYMVEFGFDLGSARTLYDVISSLMVDGSLTYSPSAGNRESVRLSVLVEAPDSAESATFGAALDVEAAKDLNTLTFHPGDGFGPATALDTFPAQVAHDWDQDLERAGLRRFIVEIPALPFGRSEDPVSFTWTGAGAELSPLTSLAGWTVVSGATPTVVADADEGTTSALHWAAPGVIDFVPSVALQEYLWIKADDLMSFTAVSVGGVAATIPDVSDALWFAGGRYFVAVPVPAEAVGTTQTIRLTATTGADLFEFYTVGYASPVMFAADTFPRGIGMVDVVGSARAPFTVTFTAPAGGAFVYTAPDPNVAILRGAGEVVFGHFEVNSPDGAELTIGSQVAWFPEGEHSAQVGGTAGRASELFPDGLWPQEASGAASWDGGDIDAGAFQFAYPADSKASVSFFDTSGSKSLVSPSPSLPQGYHGDAVHHETHVLHPSRSGFAVLDQNGAPISAVVTYYPRWWSHAAQ